MALAFHHLVEPACNEVAKPEWWNDEDLKTHSKAVASVTSVTSATDLTDQPGREYRINGHMMRMAVLGCQYSDAWKLGPRSAADFNEAATHAGLAAQLYLAGESSMSSSCAVSLLKFAADLFGKAADKELIEAKIKAAKAGAKEVVRAEAETKANAAADALLAEEAAEAAEAMAAATSSAPAKGKGKKKGKGKSSGKP